MSHLSFIVSLIIAEVDCVCVYLLEISFSSPVTCFPILFTHFSFLLSVSCYVPVYLT